MAAMAEPSMHRIAGKFRVIIWFRGVGPLVDMEVLVLQGMRQFVRHHHALIRRELSSRR